MSMIMPSWNLLPFRPRAVGICIACALGLFGYYASAEEVQFNTDVLDVKIAKILIWASSRVADISCRAII